MARKFKISQLILKGRRACDQENSALLSPAEWQDEFSSIYSEFQSAIVEGGARVFESVEAYTADGSSDYGLPAAFMSELGVDYELSSDGEKVALDLLAVQERNVTSGNSSNRALYYAIINNVLRLYPSPSSGTYYLTYIPQSPDLSTVPDTDEVDVIVPAGEQFFKWSLAFAGASKEDSDQTGHFERRAAQARAEVVKWSYQRHLTQPKRKHVSDNPLDAGEYEPGDWL